VIPLNNHLWISFIDCHPISAAIMILFCKTGLFVKGTRQRNLRPKAPSQSTPTGRAPTREFSSLPSLRKHPCS
jgi:hypothetical protein